jgi:formyl-CoA transferase
VPGILEGLRVVELSQLIAAPLCGLMLGDWGAEVVKVEPPEGDYTRSLPPWLPSGESAYHQMLNRGKHSVVLDLRDPASARDVEALVDDADVVVESLGEAVRHLGVDPAAAQRRNPRLVWCSVTGMGAGAGGRAIDPTLQASMGMMALTGQPDGPPTRLPVPLIDFMTAMYASQSVLAALLAIERGAPGAFLDCAMLDAAATLTSSSGVMALSGQETLRRMGSQNLWYVPADNFQAADGAWVQLMAISERHWRGVAEALGHPEWIEAPGFASNADRVANRDGVHAAIAEVIRTRSASEWETLVTRAGGFCRRVAEIEEAWADPALVARGLAQRLPGASDDTQLLPTVSLARDPLAGPPRMTPAPRLGEHTSEVLGAARRRAAGEVAPR